MMTTMTVSPTDQYAPAIERLKRDVKKSAATMTPRQARYLVDAYYTMQDNRIRAAGQVRSASEGAEPHEAVEWLAEQARTLENRVKSILDTYSASEPLGVWARSNKGVGPVIAAGLLAHIDVMRTPTVGHIWRFAGLDPTIEWGKGQKRPYNASLKTLCAFKLGESFVKVSGYPDAFYGQVYRQRKSEEVEKNERGDNANEAARILEAKRIGKATEAFKHYSVGKLPPAHVHARARRYTVKLFLSHYHHVGWVLATGEAPPKPYAIAHLDHAHYIEPPNFQ